MDVETVSNPTQRRSTKTAKGKEYEEDLKRRASVTVVKNIEYDSSEYDSECSLETSYDNEDEVLLIEGMAEPDGVSSVFDVGGYEVVVVMRDNSENDFIIADHDANTEVEVVTGVLNEVLEAVDFPTNDVRGNIIHVISGDTVSNQLVTTVNTDNTDLDQEDGVNGGDYNLIVPASLIDRR